MHSIRKNLKSKKAKESGRNSSRGFFLECIWLLKIFVQVLCNIWCRFFKYQWPYESIKKSRRKQFTKDTQVKSTRTGLWSPTLEKNTDFLKKIQLQLNEYKVEEDYGAQNLLQQSQQLVNRNVSQTIQDKEYSGKEENSQYQCSYLQKLKMYKKCNTIFGSQNLNTKLPSSEIDMKDEINSKLLFLPSINELPTIAEESSSSSCRSEENVTSVSYVCENFMLKSINEKQESYRKKQKLTNEYDDHQVLIFDKYFPNDCSRYSSHDSELQIVDQCPQHFQLSNEGKDSYLEREASNKHFLLEHKSLEEIKQSDKFYSSKEGCISTKVIDYVEGLKDEEKKHLSTEKLHELDSNEMKSLQYILPSERMICGQMIMEDDSQLQKFNQFSKGGNAEEEERDLYLNFQYIHSSGENQKNKNEEQVQQGCQNNENSNQKMSNVCSFKFVKGVKQLWRKTFNYVNRRIISPQQIIPILKNIRSKRNVKVKQSLKNIQELKKHLSKFKKRLHHEKKKEQLEDSQDNKEFIQNMKEQIDCTSIQVFQNDFEDTQFIDRKIILQNKNTKKIDSPQPDTKKSHRKIEKLDSQQETIAVSLVQKENQTQHQEKNNELSVVDGFENIQYNSKMYGQKLAKMEKLDEQDLLIYQEHKTYDQENINRMKPIEHKQIPNNQEQNEECFSTIEEIFTSPEANAEYKLPEQHRIKEEIQDCTKFDLETVKMIEDLNQNQEQASTIENSEEISICNKFNDQISRSEEIDEKQYDSDHHCCYKLNSDLEDNNNIENFRSTRQKSNSSDIRTEYVSPNEESNIQKDDANYLFNFVKQIQDINYGDSNDQKLINELI